MNAAARTACWILLILTGFSSSAYALTVNVAPTGSDEGNGPFRTLARAQNAARELKASSANGQVEIHVAAGVYYLDEPLKFTAADSKIDWIADVNGSVVISGGRKLDLSWKPYQKGIFQAQVSADVSTDQLFVNGQRQILSRYPNFDPNVLVFNGYAADCVSPERVARWNDPVGGIMHAMHPSQWGGFSYLITGKDDHGGVTLEGGWQGNRAAKPHKQLRYVENIFEELDSPGEWFLDNKTHTLYYYPPSGLDLAKATIEVVRLRHLLEFNGSMAAPVREVTFRGFTLRHTLRTFMETREPLLRSDWTIYRGGAVLFDGAEDCTLRDCFIDQVGGNAVFVNNYNRRITITGCRIEKSGAGGVMFVGDPKAVRSPLFEYAQRQPVEKIDRTPGALTGNYPADCRVDNCLITQVGRVEKQSTGVGIDMSARITVSHCSIYDMPRAGINIGDGCWGGNIIEFCDIFDTVKETGDHGSFNSWGRDRYWVSNIKEVNRRVAGAPELPMLDVVEPNTLYNNRWRCDHGWDIDLDDGSSNYHIYNNLCLHGGIKNREGFGRVVENNVMVNNSFHPHVWFDNSGDVFARNIVSQPYHPIGMPKTWGKQIDNNLLHDSSGADTQAATALQKFSGQDAHSLRGDAMFVDPEHGDFRVRDGSPALKLGFKNFPMDQFGVMIEPLHSMVKRPSFGQGAELEPARDAGVSDWMGAKVRNIIGLGERSASSDAGVLVLHVPADSALAKAGLRENDVIVGVDGKVLDDVATLLKTARKLPLKCDVSRDQQIIKLRIVGN
jgi:hypothetical protein